MEDPFFEVVIVGAGAAGMMCGIEAARRGRSVLVVEHCDRPGKKIRISGGGRCNFTHLDASPKNFISQNPHFCISALKRFTPWDFLQRVQQRGIAYYEKTPGRLFCVHSAQQIVDLLWDDLCEASAQTWLGTSIEQVRKVDTHFELTSSRGLVRCDSLVLATGGLSIPKMGATGWAYDIARQFGHSLTAMRAGLVPLQFSKEDLNHFEGLSGVSFEASVRLQKNVFRDGLLFTHRGLSGPSILQISNYWLPGNEIAIDLLPDLPLAELLQEKRHSHPRHSLGPVLGEYLPRRLVDRLLQAGQIATRQNVGELSNDTIQKVAQTFHDWKWTPAETEGYRTAEVTLGGIDTRDISSQTMESKLCPGLYFVGECVDVTGWLGGYNFQWAWSSGWAAGQAV